MRFVALLASLAFLSGCVGTRVVEIDPKNGSDRHTLAEAARAQSGEILTDRDLIEFKKNKLQLTRDTLRVEPIGNASDGRTEFPLYDGPLEVRFRYRGSPLGALFGTLVGGGFGYLTGSSAPDCSGYVCIDPKIVGTAAGGIVGAIVGAFVGPKRTTIYRFRPDSPQQMSVVIGVGSTQ